MISNALGPDSVQTDADAVGIQAYLSDDPSFRNHADGWLSFQTDVEVHEILLLLLLPVPILSEKARRLCLPKNCRAAVSG